MRKTIDRQRAHQLLDRLSPSQFESVAELLERYAKNGKKADWNRFTDLSSPEALNVFREAAKAYDKRINRSPETARQALISEGILTKSGKLSKNYR